MTMMGAAEMFDVVRRQIDEAYQRTAPKQPYSACYVMIPYPPGIFDHKAEGEALTVLIREAMPTALHAEVTQKGTSRFPDLPPIRHYGSPERPLIVVVFRPWAEAQGAA